MCVSLKGGGEDIGVGVQLHVFARVNNTAYTSFTQVTHTWTQKYSICSVPLIDYLCMVKGSYLKDDISGLQRAGPVLHRSVRELHRPRDCRYYRRGGCPRKFSRSRWPNFYSTSVRTRICAYFLYSTSPSKFTYTVSVYMYGYCSTAVLQWYEMTQKISTRKLLYLIIST